MKASNITIKQNGKLYTKISMSNEEKHILAQLGRVSYWNHYVFMGKHNRTLTDAQKQVRVAGRTGNCLRIDGDYFVRF